MWKRRDPSDPEPPEERSERPEPATASASPAVEAPVTESPLADPVPPEAEPDDPYSQLENFFTEPIVLEDPSPQPSAATVPPRPAASEPPIASGPGEAVGSDTVQRLEQFAQRLAARFEALEGQVQEGSARTLESLRRLGERMGAELAMLDKRAVNLELTMARLRSTTEALERSLRKLPDPDPAEPEEDESLTPGPAVIAEEPPTAGDALFTLDEEVPPSEWDEPPPEDAPPPDPTWP